MKTEYDDGKRHPGRGPNDRRVWSKAHGPSPPPPDDPLGAVRFGSLSCSNLWLRRSTGPKGKRKESSNLCPCANRPLDHEQRYAIYEAHEMYGSKTSFLIKTAAYQPSREGGINARHRRARLRSFPWQSHHAIRFRRLLAVRSVATWW